MQHEPIETLQSLTRTAHPLWGAFQIVAVLAIPLWLHAGIFWQLIANLDVDTLLVYWGGETLTRFTVIQSLVLATIAATGVWLAWRRVVAADAQTAIANTTARYTELGHWSDRFTNAVKTLTSQSLAERIAGISVIGEIGREGPEVYKKNCIRTLEGFLQQHCRVAKKDQNEQITTDCQHALSILITLQSQAQLPKIDLADCAFARAEFSGLVVNFTLNRCTMFASRFNNAVFSNCEFFSAEFQTLFCDVNFVDCRFDDASICPTDLIYRHNRCGFLRCDFDNASFGPQSFANSYFSDCLWSKARFRSVSFNLNDPRLKDVERMLAARWDLATPPSFKISGDADNEKVRAAINRRLEERRRILLKREAANINRSG